MRAEKLRELDNDELKRQMAEMNEQKFRLRFQLNMGQADGLKKLHSIRKDRARILTILRDRELHPETAPEPTPNKKKAKSAKKKKGK